MQIPEYWAAWILAMCGSIVILNAGYRTGQGHHRPSWVLSGIGFVLISIAVSIAAGQGATP